MKHLILFTIGPVQSFISQARKTHDLYAGSKLLSDLIKVAIDFVGASNLIFPKKGDSMPNRFLAYVPDGISDYKDFGTSVERSVREAWNKIANDAVHEFREKPAGFSEQIENFLEIFWVIKPLDKEYPEVYAEIERELAAMKNARSFKQYSWQENIVGERGRKCNLDGIRNVQFYRSKGPGKVNAKKSPLFTTQNGVLISQRDRNEELQPGEGLSAVSFVKRKYFYDKKLAFKSTSEIALLDALNDLDRKENIKGFALLKNYKNYFSSFNPQLFYEEGINDDALRKQGIITKNESTDGILFKLRELKGCTDFKFSKYYAVLVFDGDDMGKWWSGVHLKNKVDLEEFQTALTHLLLKYAQKAKQLLNSGSGEAVYAGGDDFLGLVNLNHLWDTLKKLRLIFKKEVSDQISDYTNDEISFSAGICVAQYKEPLSLVIEEARKAEKRAKDCPGKNAFSISVIKSSGENHYATLPFDEDAVNIDRINVVISSLVEEDFSNNFIENLEREFELLANPEKTIFELENIFRLELERLIKRSASPNLKNKDEKIQILKGDLMNLLGSMKMRNFFQLLAIIDFFQRTIDNVKRIDESLTIRS